MSAEKMKQKENYFQKFLQDCLRNEDLRASYFLMEFLSLADEKAFGKMMKDWEREKHPQLLSQYYTHDGELKVSSTVETWRYCHNLPDFTERYWALN